MTTARDEHSDGEQRAHAAALAAITLAWRNGQISTVQKRDKIAAENRLYYGGAKRGPTEVSLTSVPVPDGYAALLAEQMNIPLDIARKALAARRAASVRALHAPTIEEGNAMRAAGVARYNAILGDAIHATSRERPTLPLVMPGAQDEERDEWYQR